MVSFPIGDAALIQELERWTNRLNQAAGLAALK
jgi:hypothetical protein